MVKQSRKMRSRSAPTGVEKRLSNQIVGYNHQNKKKYVTFLASQVIVQDVMLYERLYDKEPASTQISPFATLSAMLLTSMLPGWICKFRQQGHVDMIAEIVIESK